MTRPSKKARSADDMAKAEATEAEATEPVEGRTAEAAEAGTPEAHRTDETGGGGEAEKAPEKDPASEESGDFADPGAAGAGEVREELGTNRAEAGKQSRRRRIPIRAGVLVLVVLPLVAVLLAAAVVILWIKDDRLKAEEDASREAVRAAAQTSRDLSSYDYRTLESDFRTATGETTGKLREQYAALAQQIHATAVQQQAISQTTVIKAGAETVSADRVIVIVFANRSSTTTSSQNRLPDSLRIRITMVNVKGRWLASGLQVL
jgi:Mce-associated membrane protein